MKAELKEDDDYNPSSSSPNANRHYETPLGVPNLAQARFKDSSGQYSGNSGDRRLATEGLNEADFNEGGELDIGAGDMEGEGDNAGDEDEDGDGPDDGGDDTRTYCYCERVSYGSMIGCDGDDCKREWFHLACAGLTDPPRGMWYCDECLEKRRSLGNNPNKKRKS